MEIDQLNWISGLDKSGIVALILFTIFFIIAIITIAMMIKINSEHKRFRRERMSRDEQEAIPETQRRTAATADNQSHKESPKQDPNENDESSDPLEQAEIYLTYGLNKQAEDLLKEYLEKNPSDKTASEMLARAQQ